METEDCTTQEAAAIVRELLFPPVFERGPERSLPLEAKALPWIEAAPVERKTKNKATDSRSPALNFKKYTTSALSDKLLPLDKANQQPPSAPLPFCAIFTAGWNEERRRLRRRFDE